MSTEHTPTPLDLEAIRQRVEAATPGPWQALGTGVQGGDHWYVCDAGEAIASIACDDGSNEDQREPDATFIALAREDVPALLAEVERLRAGIADAVETARVSCRQLGCTPTCGCTCCDLRDDLVTLTRQTEGA